MIALLFLAEVFLVSGAAGIFGARLGLGGGAIIVHVLKLSLCHNHQQMAPERTRARPERDKMNWYHPVPFQRMDADKLLLASAAYPQTTLRSVYVRFSGGIRAKPLPQTIVRTCRTKAHYPYCSCNDCSATVLLLSLEGRTVQEIAAGMGLHVQTVRERIRTFNRADHKTCWELFRPPPRFGRPLRYGAEVQQGLVDLLKQSPEHFRLDTDVWRLYDLVRVAKRTHLVGGSAQRTFNAETVRRRWRPAG